MNLMNIKNFRKSFTLIEIIIVLVMLSILAMLSTAIIVQISKKYRITDQLHNLDYQTDIGISQLKQLLLHRVKNSVIVDKCDVNNGNCYKGIVEDFKSILLL